MGAAGANVDVAIVAYRCEELLRRCLRSVREHGECVARIIVVDNASGDGTAEMVRREFPSVELRVNGRNEGFAAGMNRAIASGSAEYVLALNPDAELRAGTLARLKSVMQSRPEVAISGPRLERPGGGSDHAAARGFPTPLSALGHFTGIARRRRAPAAFRGYAVTPREGGPVDAVNGAFMLIRRSAFERLGGFDPGYWMYMEDLDLCYRARRAGYLTWYEPGAVATHLKAGSSGEARSVRLNGAFHYGMLRFYRAHLASVRPPLENLLVYSGIGVRFLTISARDAVRRTIRAARPPAEPRDRTTTRPAPPRR